MHFVKSFDYYGKAVEFIWGFTFIDEFCIAPVFEHDPFSYDVFVSSMQYLSYTF